MVIPTGLPHSSIFSYSELVLTRSYCALICPSRSHCSLRHLRASRPPAPLALSRLCVRHGPSSGEHAHAHCNSDPKSCTRTGGGVAWCGVLGHIVDAHMHNSMELRSLLIFTPPSANHEPRISLTPAQNGAKRYQSELNYPSQFPWSSGYGARAMPRGPGPSRAIPQGPS
jgi:hypothetical protein